MMGGELAEEITAENSMGDLDETHEAESESDLSAGRMANRGRTALLAAIRAMSRAATALNVAELERGLVHEKTAVRELESAFSRTRYLLRAFTEREQLDLTRRLSGNLEDARSSQRNVAIADEDGSRKLREALGQISAVTDSGDHTALAVAAEHVLAVDPSSRELQQISSQLSRASRATIGSTGRRMLLDSATLSLAVLLRDQVGTIPFERARQPDVRRLQGALRDAMERNNLVARPPDSRR